MLNSVVIPRFNEEHYLGETLASLYRAIAFLKKIESTSSRNSRGDNNSLDSSTEKKLFGTDGTKQWRGEVAENQQIEIDSPRSQAGF